MLNFSFRTCRFYAFAVNTTQANGICAQRTVLASFLRCRWVNQRADRNSDDNGKIIIGRSSESKCYFFSKSKWILLHLEMCWPGEVKPFMFCSVVCCACRSKRKMTAAVTTSPFRFRFRRNSLDRFVATKYHSKIWFFYYIRIHRYERTTKEWKSTTDERNITLIFSFTCHM